MHTLLFTARKLPHRRFNLLRWIQLFRWKLHPRTQAVSPYQASWWFRSRWSRERTIRSNDLIARVCLHKVNLIFIWTRRLLLPIKTKNRGSRLVSVLTICIRRLTLRCSGREVYAESQLKWKHWFHLFSNKLEIAECVFRLLQTWHWSSCIYLPMVILQQHNKILVPSKPFNYG